MSSKFLRVMALSKTPADFKKKESAPPTESVPHTVSISHTASVSHTVSVPHTETISPTETVLGPRYSRPKPRPAKIAQDGHSHAEQAVYAALWDNAKPTDDETRLISIGFGRLSKLSRLSENNCRQNVRSLIRKLALEELKPEHSALGVGKTYKVFGYASILARRKAAGMTWVIRTKGVVFVHPNTGLEFVSAPPAVSVSPTVSPPPPPTVSVGESPTVSVPPFRNSFRNKEEEPSSSAVVEVQGAIAKHIAIDDDAVLQIIQGCRRNDPGCTDDEIAHFAGLSAAKIRHQRNVDNPAGLLINQAPRFFPGAELQAYRARKAKEIAEGREIARRVLEDPQASPQELEWAKTVIPDGRAAENEG
jgi:hypothetical protein